MAEVGIVGMLIFDAVAGQRVSLKVNPTLHICSVRNDLNGSTKTQFVYSGAPNFLIVYIPLHGTRLIILILIPPESNTGNLTVQLTMCRSIHYTIATDGDNKYLLLPPGKMFIFHFFGTYGSKISVKTSISTIMILIELSLMTFHWGGLSYFQVILL